MSTGPSAEAAANGEAKISKFHQWRLVAILNLLSIVCGVDRQIFALLMEPIRASMGLSSFQVGLLHGVAFAMFFCVFGVIFGWAVDHFDRRKVVYIGVTIWSAAATACGLAGSFLQLAIARFGLGAGQAALNPSAYSMISDTFPRNRLSTAISVYGTGFVMGSAFSMIIGGALARVIPQDGVAVPLLGLMPPWRLILLITGAPGLLLAFLIWIVNEPTRQQRLEDVPKSLGAAMQYMRENVLFFAPFFVAIGFVSASGYAIITWMSSHLMRKFGLTMSEVGLLLGPLQIVPGIFGLLFSGAITDYLYARGRRDAGPRVLIGLTLLQVVPALVIAVADTVWLNCAAVAFFMLCATGAAGIGPAALQLVTPNNYRGQVSATFMFTTNLVALTLGPPMVGALVSYMFSESPTAVGSAVAIVIAILNPIAALLYWIALKGMRRIRQ